jgi:hypothetical protein
MNKNIFEWIGDFLTGWLRPNPTKPKDAGIGGVLIFIGTIMLVFSVGRTLFFMVAGASLYSVFSIFNIFTLIGVILVVVGFIIMPGKSKKDIEGLREEERGYISKTCAVCNCDLRYDKITQTYADCIYCKSVKKCRDCGTVLLFSESAQLYNCPYCHIEFSESEL